MTDGSIRQQIAPRCWRNPRRTPLFRPTSTALCVNSSTALPHPVFEPSRSRARSSNADSGALDTDMYCYATGNLDSLRMQLSRLLHCPTAFYRYSAAERALLSSSFVGNFRDACHHPDSTPDSWFALLEEDAMAILRINLEEKGIRMDEK